MSPAQLCDRLDGREKTMVAWRVFVRWQVNADVLVVVALTGGWQEGG